MKNEALKITNEDGYPSKCAIICHLPVEQTNVYYRFWGNLANSAHYTWLIRSDSVWSNNVVKLRLDLPLSRVLQTILHNLKVWLSAEQITWVNNSGNELPPMSRDIHEP